MKLLVLLGIVFIVACSDSSDKGETAEELMRSSNVEYAPEDLLGKTVAEYEAALNESTEEEENPSSPISYHPEELANSGFKELVWDDLVAPGYDTDSIIKKYQPQIDQIEHGSIDALKLYEKMEEEFSNAPVNSALQGKKVSVPGFIAPLEQVGSMITEFLLVPYFGACIHLPPPPANQTLHVKVAPSYEIDNDDSYAPVWISGELDIVKTSTDIGNASYQVVNAVISKYQEY